MLRLQEEYFLPDSWAVTYAVIFGQTAAQHVLSPYLHLDPVVSVAQVLQVGCGVGLDGGEVMLQHVDDLRKLGIAPRKLPEERQRGELKHSKTIIHVTNNLQ